MTQKLSTLTLRQHFHLAGAQGRAEANNLLSLPASALGAAVAALNPNALARVVLATDCDELAKLLPHTEGTALDLLVSGGTSKLISHLLRAATQGPGASQQATGTGVVLYTRAAASTRLQLLQHASDINLVALVEGLNEEDLAQLLESAPPPILTRILAVCWGPRMHRMHHSIPDQAFENLVNNTFIHQIRGTQVTHVPADVLKRMLNCATPATLKFMLAQADDYDMCKIVSQASTATLTLLMRVANTRQLIRMLGHGLGPGDQDRLFAIITSMPLIERLGRDLAPESLAELIIPVVDDLKTKMARHVYISPMRACLAAAGDAGRVLSDQVGPIMAAAMIYDVSIGGVAQADRYAMQMLLQDMPGLSIAAQELAQRQHAAEVTAESSREPNEHPAAPHG